MRNRMFLLGAILLAAGFAQADIISNFTIDDENWESNGDAQSHGWAFSVGSGTPKGSFHVFDDATGQVWYFAAPEKFLGNKSGYYGGNLSYEIRVSGVDASDWGVDPYVKLSGNGITLSWYLNQMPETGVWCSYSVGLVETAGWLNSANGSAATKAQMQAVLSNLNSIQIRGEFYTGSDNGYIDNVVMAIPEPVTVMLTGMGLLLIRRK